MSYPNLTKTTTYLHKTLIQLLQLVWIKEICHKSLQDRNMNHLYAFLFTFTVCFRTIFTFFVFIELIKGLDLLLLLLLLRSY